MIGIAEKQGRKTLEFRDAEVVYVGEVKTGVSMTTGNEWKLRHINLKINLGTNMQGEKETMMLCAKCAGELCDKMGMMAVGTHIHAFVRFNLNVHFNVPKTECNLVDFQL